MECDKFRIDYEIISKINILRVKAVHGQLQLRENVLI